MRGTRGPSLPSSNAGQTNTQAPDKALDIVLPEAEMIAKLIVNQEYDRRPAARRRCDQKERKAVDEGAENPAEFAKCNPRGKRGIFLCESLVTH